MSRHWAPDRDRTRWRRAEGRAPPNCEPWPRGATAGLVMVAAGCLAIGLLLYKAADPGYEIERNAAGDWNSTAPRSRD